MLSIKAVMFGVRFSFAVVVVRPKLALTCVVATRKGVSMEKRRLVKFAFVMALLTVAIGCCDHCADMLSLAVSPDGKLISSLCGEYNACVWDASSGKLIQKIETNKPSFSAVAYSPTTDLLATGSSDGTVTLWEARTGKRTFVLQNDIHNYWVFSEAFSPNGEELAAAGMGWPVRVWNVKTGMVIRQLAESAIPYGDCFWQESRFAGRGMPPAVSHDQDKTCLAYSLAYSPDGKTIAVGSKLWLRLWDAASGKPIRSFPGAANVGAIVFSPDGGLLASAEEDGGIAIWNASIGIRVRGFQLSPRPLRAIAFSPDGQNLAASGWDGNIYICESRSGTVVRKIAASRGAVNWVFFSADGGNIVSGSRDDDFFGIWQVSTGRQVRQISCLSAVSP